MKIPQVGTIESVALLGVGVFVAYALYKTYKAGQSIKDSVTATVGEIVDDVKFAANKVDLGLNKVRTTTTGGDFSASEDQSAAETARLKAAEQNAAWNDWANDTPNDEPTFYNAMGDFNLGMDSTTQSVPQFSSPAAVSGA